MDAASIGSLLRDVADGSLAPEDALTRLASLPLAAAPDLLLDTHRELRTGVPEAIYAPGKTVTQVLDAARTLLASTTGPVLVTRADDAQRRAIGDAFPDAQCDDVARTAILRAAPGEARGSVLIVTAGTSDLPVAAEAAATLTALGVTSTLSADRGVAGLHRTLAIADGLRDADVVIVCAGMEGALPSVVGGLTAAPIVAVPTSTGYGASFEGATALLSMLATCSPGIGVVGIDNGFGAAVLATRILRRRAT